MEFWLENVTRRDHLEDLGKDGWDNCKIGQESVDWIYVAHNGDQCKAFVNVVMNFQLL
jgi:hypothetical protein